MMDRRSFLRYVAGTSAGLVAGPAVWSASGARAAAPADFVDDYLTNTTANLTAETNAAVRVLTGMQRLWQTGTAWNSGVPLRLDVLRANIRHVAAVTAARTEEQAKLSFIIDRRHQSYSAIDGLGALAEPYRVAAKAVTGITVPPTAPRPPRSATRCRPVRPPGRPSVLARRPPSWGSWSSSSTRCAARTPPATRASCRTSTRARGG